jgi:hypothetical protein
MQEFLRENGIEAIPKYIATGSLKRSWRLYGKDADGHFQKWTPELAKMLNSLGFRGLNEPLDIYDGNGGLFSVFVRGHNEFL